VRTVPQPTVPPRQAGTYAIGLKSWAVSEGVTVSSLICVVQPVKLWCYINSIGLITIISIVIIKIVPVLITVDYIDEMKTHTNFGRLREKLIIYFLFVPSLFIIHSFIHSFNLSFIYSIIKIIFLDSFSVQDNPGWSLHLPTQKNAIVHGCAFLGLK